MYCIKTKKVNYVSKQYIVVGSVTYAMRGRDVLSGNAISSRVEKISDSRLGGCGYALYVPDDFEKAVKLLKENGIKIKGTLRGDNVDIF